MLRNLTVAIAILGAAINLGCSHILLHTAKYDEPSAPSRMPSSNEQNYEKVAAYFNQGAKDSLERNDVKIIENHLISVSAHSKNVGGHFLEDCRKEAIRQGILDATAAGYSFESLSRGASHRFELFEDAGFKEDAVGAMVGLNISQNGQPDSITYTYDLDDDSSGNCDWKRTVSAEPGLQKRRDVEKRMFGQVWPKVSDKRKQEFRSRKKFKGMKDEEIVAKMVGKLIEFSCEETSLSGATKAAQEFFRGKFHSQPIVHLDFSKSSVRSNISEEGRKGQLDKLEGYWAFRMSDPSGTNTASAKVDFSLKEKADGTCEGQVSSTAEPF